MSDTEKELQQANELIVKLVRALNASDAVLSLIRHRADGHIPWGNPGLPDRWEVDTYIGQSRNAVKLATNHLGGWPREDGVLVPTNQ